MKVILISANARLGKIGDVVEVKSGYAKNFLIPQKQAICFTSANAKIFEARKGEFEKENAQKLDTASKIKSKIDGKDIVILQNASDDGRLYGSVNSSLIAAKINEIAGEKSVVRSQVVLQKVIKEIGIYDALVNLHSDVSASVRLIVSRSESEVAALLKALEKTSAKEEVANDSKVKEKVAEEKEVAAE